MKMYFDSKIGASKLLIEQFVHYQYLHLTLNFVPDFLKEVSLYEIFHRPFLKNFSNSDHRIYLLAWSHFHLVLLKIFMLSKVQWFWFLPWPRSILFATKIIVACSSHSSLTRDAHLSACSIPSSLEPSKKIIIPDAFRKYCLNMFVKN